MNEEKLKKLVEDQQKTIADLDRHQVLVNKMGGTIVMMKGYLLALRADRKIPGVDQMLECIERSMQEHEPDAPSKPDERGK